MDITGIAQVLESQARLSDIPTISASMSKKSVRMKKKGTSVHRLKVVTWFMGIPLQVTKPIIDG